MRARLAFGLFMALAPSGCSSSNSGTPLSVPSCAAPETVSIFNGAPQETYLGLGPAQIRAIVEVADATNVNGALCSGAFVTPSWVVTAGHCVQIASPEVIAHGPDGPIAYSVLSTIANPDVDVALLMVALKTADAETADIAPLTSGNSSVSALAVGNVVEVAGYGLTEKNSVGSLRFLAESIVGIDGSTLTVSGFGASGACGGDSGGPLLMRARDGAPVVAAVLSMGSGTCLEADTYVRLDTIAPWIAQTVGAYTSTDRECGTITRQGRCLYGSALVCEGSALVAYVCGGDTRCGWNSSQASFRCVYPEIDPCDGVDFVGACVGNDALACNRGLLDHRPCAVCGACRVDGKTGRPYCLSRSAEAGSGD